MESSRLASRIEAIAGSATLQIDAKAKALKRSGRPVISFAAGEPDFSTPANIVEAAVRAARDPSSHRYTPAAGLPELRHAIAEKTARDSKAPASAESVLVTNGGKQAVFQAFAALLNNGDEVLVPGPYWTTYPEVIRLAGGVPIMVFAQAENGYKVTVEQLERLRTPRTKVLLFVSPSNPTGAVYGSEATTEIGTWARDHGLYVVADEIYQNLTFDTDVAPSILGLVPELEDRAILVNGVAKSYAMTGWRLGWMVGPRDIISACTNLQSHLTSNVSNVSQSAALEALTGPQDEAQRMRVTYMRRRDTVVRMLSGIPSVVAPVPGGAFYVYPDISKLLGRSWQGTTARTSAELANLLLDQLEVAVVPGEAFGRSGAIRLSYALGDSDLEEGLDRMRGLFS